jgi:hypothetical protein
MPARSVVELVHDYLHRSAIPDSENATFLAAAREFGKAQ